MMETRHFARHFEAPARGHGGRRSRTGWHRYWAFLGVLLIALTLSAGVAAQAQDGVECGCTETGPYEDPDPGKKPYVNPNNGQSPNGIYQVTASPGGTNGMAELTVRRVADNKTVLNNVQATNWGFSPDDHRFVYHSVTNGVHNVALYDLGKGQKVRPDLNDAASSSRIQFSPTGKYLFYSYLDSNGQANLLIVDTETGVTRYSTTFSFQSVPGADGDEFGVAGWGFGPRERTFVHAYKDLNGQIQWNVVNLETKQVVRSEPLNAVSAFWQFSPCGDVIGLVEQPNQSQVSVRLFRTADGTAIPSQHQTFPLDSVELRSEPASHIAKVGGTDRTLASNTADSACPNAPPNAAFTAPSDARAKEPAQFTDDSTDTDGTISSWQWSFGDGGASTQQDPAHTYSSAGTYTVSLKVTDNKGATDTATKQVSVVPANSPPVAQDLSVTTDENTPKEITLSATDPEGDPLTYAVVASPDHGFVSGNGPGMNYEPYEDYSGADSFEYTANDGTDDSNVATVTITVNAVNDPPIISDIPDQSTENDLSTEPLPFFVKDAETAAGDLVVTGASKDQQIVPDAGIDIQGTGQNRTLEITPAPGKVGSAEISLSVKDAEGNTTTDTSVLTVVAGNDPPTAPDPSFGADDRALTSFGQGTGEAEALALQTDGKLVAAGTTGSQPGLDFALARYNPDGSLDPGFGNGGGRTTDFGLGNDSAGGLVIQPDDRLVVAGGALGMAGKCSVFALARYGPGGSLDPTFDKNGKVTEKRFCGNLNDVVLQPDGKILAAGAVNTFSNTDLAVARYNPDGSLDAGFGTDGVVTTRFDPSEFYHYEQAHALVLQPDGKIVVAGGYTNGQVVGQADFALVRYNPDGSLDTTFDDDGKLTTDFGSGVEPSYDRAYDLVLQSDGKIVAAGRARESQVGKFALARYNPDGSPDQSFGEDLDGDGARDGKLTTTFPGTEVGASGLLLRPDDKLVAAGTAGDMFGGEDFALARYNPDGSPDTSFDGDGKLTTNLGPDRGDSARDLVLRPDGGMVAAGVSTKWSPYEENFALVRYRAGEPDTMAPTVESVAPTGRKVSPKANVTATFSEAMDKATITRSTFKLFRKDSTRKIAATVGYSAATRKATLNPVSNLERGAIYEATVTIGAKDRAGNALAQPKAWTFKVRR